MELPSFGVEEELLLVSATGEPLPRSTRVAAEVEGIELELTRAQVEINSPVCTTAAELHGHLTEMRRKLASAAADEGARLLAIGAPPSGQANQLVTKKPRYQEMAARYGQLAREQGVCGCHVHIDVPDKETALRVSNHLRPWLPVLLAMTANSAVYLGQDTGFSSWRHIMWSRWPCSGPPPYFESADHYDSLVATHIAAGSLMDERMVYWDVRPSTHLPTVEVRVSDVPLTVDESVLLATLVRALAMTAQQETSQGPLVDSEVLKAAYWLAARDGLDGQGLDVLWAEPRPLRDLVRQLQRRVAGALQETGDDQLVEEGVSRLLAEGNGAQKQRRTDDVVTLTEVTP